MSFRLQKWKRLQLNYRSYTFNTLIHAFAAVVYSYCYDKDKTFQWNQNLLSEKSIDFSTNYKSL